MLENIACRCYGRHNEITVYNGVCALCGARVDGKVTRMWRTAISEFEATLEVVSWSAFLMLLLGAMFMMPAMDSGSMFLWVVSALLMSPGVVLISAGLGIIIWNLSAGLIRIIIKIINS